MYMYTLSNECYLIELQSVNSMCVSTLVWVTGTACVYIAPLQAEDVRVQSHVLCPPGQHSGQGIPHLLHLTNGNAADKQKTDSKDICA